MDIAQILTSEFSLLPAHTTNIITLIDEGNTIPFIARYRKEQTGEIDDQQLRALHERLEYLRNLAERKATVRASIAEQGQLTPELDTALQKAETLAAVEDIYRPFKPKRRTRATIAAEKGLTPLAEIILLQELTDMHATATTYINEANGVTSIEEALNGASDILAEKIADDMHCRTFVRNLTFREGLLTATASKSAKEQEHEVKATTYEMYFDYAEPLIKMAGHRVLAVNRGENEGFLKINIEAPEEKIHAGLQRHYVKNNPHTRTFMEEMLADSYVRLTAPAVEREIRNTLTESAEESAIKIFAENLKQLIMQAPVKDHRILAIDPGFRTGCKLAVVDETGKVLETGVIFCTTTKDTTPSKLTLSKMLARHNVSIIAIGNGTASRETEVVVAELLKETKSSVKYIIVNEAGASVYSASKLGAEEFPDFDVALRSAVSIARRLQDPLAELVKIDPKSIGVGQYQHDMNQKKLTTALGGVVEDCVNKVGGELNTASPSLLSYVAGINPTIAKNILAFREENGKFTSRTQLKKVAKLGPKAFEQCAGFLRIPGAKNPLDNTAVHPESYHVAAQLLQISEQGNKTEASPTLAEQLQVGLPTLTDIIRELEKPWRDPGDELPPVLLRSDILSMEDLTDGMMLTGTVRNVIDFGAFVDIGVHQDGLVHISQLGNRFIKHPLEVVQVGDVVQVKVLSVDIKKKRIALTMKQ